MPYQLGECPGILAANGQAAIDGLPAGLFMLQLAFHALIAKIQAPHQPGSTLGHKLAASSRAVQRKNQSGQCSSVRMHKTGCEWPEMVADSC